MECFRKIFGYETKNEDKPSKFEEKEILLLKKKNKFLEKVFTLNYKCNYIMGLDLDTKYITICIIKMDKNENKIIYLKKEKRNDKYLIELLIFLNKNKIFSYDLFNVVIENHKKNFSCINIQNEVIKVLIDIGFIQEKIHIIHGGIKFTLIDIYLYNNLSKSKRKELKKSESYKLLKTVENSLKEQKHKGRKKLGMFYGIYFLRYIYFIENGEEIYQQIILKEKTKKDDLYDSVLLAVSYILYFQNSQNNNLWEKFKNM